MTSARVTTIGIVTGLLLAAGNVNAAVVQWDLFGRNWTAPPSTATCPSPQNNSNNCNLGTMASYDVGGRVIDFYGFTDAAGGPDVATAVMENNRGANDKGLGVLGNNDEVDANQYIRIDLGANFSSLTNWMVMFDSIDGTEVSQLGTSTHGSELLTTTMPRVWLSFTPTSQIFYFNTAGPGSSEDTLLKALKAETRAVPEPATITLLGLALLGFGFSRRRAAMLG